MPVAVTIFQGSALFPQSSRSLEVASHECGSLCNLLLMQIHVNLCEASPSMTSSEQVVGEHLPLSTHSHPLLLLVLPMPGLEKKEGDRAVKRHMEEVHWWGTLHMETHHLWQGKLNMDQPCCQTFVTDQLAFLKVTPNMVRPEQSNIEECGGPLA